MMWQFATDWGEVILALFCFLLAHALPARPGIRPAIVAAIGRPAYVGLYSLLSLLLLMWIARAAARAPFIELWPYDQVRSTIPVGGMLFVCLLLVFGLTSPNPLSLARAAGFDPDRPGVAAVVRHPVLWAALIWSGAHAIANGDLAHLMVFGAFSALAIGGMLALDARSRRRLGVQEWERLARRTSNIPFLGLARGAPLRFRTGTAIRIAAAALLYLLLLFSHEILAGVPVPL
jgi:uncharacterized membrane protein